MCSQNTPSTHNIVLQSTLVPTAVSISTPPSELHWPLQRAVSSRVTDLFINGHSSSLAGP